MVINELSKIALFVMKLPGEPAVILQLGRNNLGHIMIALNHDHDL